MVSLHSVKTQNGMITTQCQDTKWYDHYTVSRHKMVWSLHSVKTQKVTHHLNKHHGNLRTDFAQMVTAGCVLRMMGSHVTNIFSAVTCLYRKIILGVCCVTLLVSEIVLNHWQIALQHLRFSQWLFWVRSSWAWFCFAAVRPLTQ